jgi:hypothetical protein
MAARVAIAQGLKQAGAIILAGWYDSVDDRVDELIAAEIFTAILMKSDQRVDALIEDAAL